MPKASPVLFDPARNIRIILTIVLAGTPLALMNGVFLSHDVMPKVVVILFAAAVLLFLLPQWGGAISALWRQPKTRVFLYLVLAQCASLLLSSAFSTQPALSLAGTTWRRFGAAEQCATLLIATAVTCAAALKPAWIKPLFRAIAVGGGIAAVYGIFQYFGVDPFLQRELYAVEFLGGVVRPPATMGHAIYLAVYLVPIALLAASAAIGETDSRWKYMQAAIAGLACLAILLSGTRSALLAVAGGAALLIVGKSRFQLVVGAACVLLIALLIAISPAGGDLRLRFTQWYQDLGGPRLGVWRDSPTLILRNPLLGTGPETFAVEFKKVQSVALSRAYPDFYHETPHNAFLDVACGQGIPGLLILSGLFALTWLSPGSAALRSALLGILIGSFFVSFSLVLNLYLWSFAGLNAMLSDHGQQAEAAAAPAFWRIPATLLGGVFIALAVILAVPDFVYVTLRDAVTEHNAAGANEALSTAAAWSYGMPSYELWSSREMAMLGRALGNTPAGAQAWNRAAEAASIAEKSSEERFSALYQSSVLAVSTGDLTRAEAKAREAIAIAPNWYKPHLLLAQILQVMNRGDEASKQAQASVDLGWQRQP